MHDASSTVWPQLCSSPTATRNSSCGRIQRNHNEVQTFMVDCVSDAWPKAGGASAKTTRLGHLCKTCTSSHSRARIAGRQRCRHVCSCRMTCSQQALTCTAWGGMRAWCGGLRNLVLGRHVRSLRLLRQPARCGARRLCDLRPRLHARPARRGRRHFRACIGTAILGTPPPNKPCSCTAGTCRVPVSRVLVCMRNHSA